MLQKSKKVEWKPGELEAALAAFKRPITKVPAGKATTRSGKSLAKFGKFDVEAKPLSRKTLKFGKACKVAWDQDTIDRVACDEED